MPFWTQRQAKHRGEIKYTMLVFAFLAGKTPPEFPPIAAEYGISDERASEIIGEALLCDFADMALKQTHGRTYDDSGSRPILNADGTRRSLYFV